MSFGALGATAATPGARAPRGRLACCRRGRAGSRDEGLVGYGCYDNVVARIIPRITSKIITQITTHIIFAAPAEACTLA